MGYGDLWRALGTAMACCQGSVPIVIIPMTVLQKARRIWGHRGTGSKAFGTDEADGRFVSGL